MADNEQNTFAGGEGAVTAPTGNGILDGFLKLAAVATQGLTTYEDLQDRRAAREIMIANETNPPRQSLPASQAAVTNGFNSAENIQAMLFFGLSFVAIGALSIWGLKQL